VRVIVLNGVNLNMLGKRDPAVYGRLSIVELEGKI
jgi:3-dehydroquinate dehydratase